MVAFVVEATGEAESGVAALSEARRHFSSMISVDGYTYYWSGRSDGHHLQGVAMAISSRLQPSVVEVTSVDERIMVLRLKLAFGFTSRLLLLCTLLPMFVNLT